MADRVETISVSIMKYLDDALSHIDQAVDLFNVNRPADIIDKLNDVENHIKQVESVMTLIPSLAQGLKNGYIDAFNRLSEVRIDLIEKVEQRKNSNLQPNTMDTLYDEDHLLKEITIGVDNDFVLNVNNLYTDSIIDLKEYTPLSIISRMEGETELFGKLLVLIQMTTSELENLSTQYNENIRQFKSSICDGENINALYNDCNETYTKLKSLIQTHTYGLKLRRGDIIKLFQAYIGIKDNYDLYAQAVDSYTKLALESLFSDAPYIIM